MSAPETGTSVQLFCLSSHHYSNCFHQLILQSIIYGAQGQLAMNSSHIIAFKVKLINNYIVHYSFEVILYAPKKIQRKMQLSSILLQAASNELPSYRCLCIVGELYLLTDTLLIFFFCSHFFALCYRERFPFNNREKERDKKRNTRDWRRSRSRLDAPLILFVVKNLPGITLLQQTFSL